MPKIVVGDDIPGSTQYGPTDCRPVESFANVPCSLLIPRLWLCLPNKDADRRHIDMTSVCNHSAPEQVFSGVVAIS
jgi:hypothetical protein